MKLSKWNNNFECFLSTDFIDNDISMDDEMDTDVDIPSDSSSISSGNERNFCLHCIHTTKFVSVLHQGVFICTTINFFLEDWFTVFISFKLSYI
jgi:hypothetical protein